MEDIHETSSKEKPAQRTGLRRLYLGRVPDQFAAAGPEFAVAIGVALRRLSETS